MISEAERRRIEGILSRLSRCPTSDGPAPHKDVFLLALLSVFQESQTGENQFPLDDRLDKAFEKAWKTYIPDQVYSVTRIELPFGYLKNDGVWTIVPKSGCEAIVQSFSRATRRRIVDCIAFGKLSDELFAIFKNQDARSCLQQLVEDRLKRRKTERTIMPDMYNENNPFVAYLNTLQGIDANNKGSLAESQARNPLFKELRVPHPLAAEIINELTGDDGGHVILTGHAGDGKSTLALEIIRALRGFPPDDPIPDGLKKREAISWRGRTISVVKDLSECTEDERKALVGNMFRPESTERFLIVSNTGPILTLFRGNRDRTGEDVAAIEDRLLDAMDSSKRREFTFGSISFVVHNLARKDNLDLGMSLLEKMVLSSQWGRCQSCSASGRCPLFANRNLLLKFFPLVSQRIWMLYFRAYAYGERFTMRQMSAHFSFLLTGGASCREMAARVASGAEIRLERHLFTNLFWGDDGKNDIPQAVRQLHVVSVMREQHFDARFSPREERQFWNFGGGNPLATTDAALAELETRTRGGKKSSLCGLDAALMRRQYRRLVFFLGSPVPNGNDGFLEFLSAFLNSPRLLDVKGWRDNPASFKAKSLIVPIYNVLQEEFSGMRPPEGAGKVGTLFITLNRRTSEIRQSVQLVLSKFEFHDNLEIRLVDGTPMLCGIGKLDGIQLDLPLPFLDYITAQNKGELGRGLQRSYRDRIEDLKARILAAIHMGDAQGLVLLRRRTDGTLSTVSVKPIDDAKALEVAND